MTGPFEDEIIEVAPKRADKNERRNKAIESAAASLEEATAELIDPTADEAFTDSIHTAVLAAKEKPQPKIRKKRGRKPPLTVEQVLLWADEHNAQTGAWPKVTSGSVRGVIGETWARIGNALTMGLRGLQRGGSLPQLLESERGVRNHMHLPNITIDEIMSWADRYYTEHNRWPRVLSGKIEGADLSWLAVDLALRRGERGLPGGGSIARLLDERRGVRNRVNPPDLSIDAILEWADAYHMKHGCWPSQNAGSIDESPQDTWKAIQVALLAGLRGLPGGDTLMRLLHQRRGLPYRLHRPDLAASDIVSWMTSYNRRTGEWPRDCSGAIPESPGDTWNVVNKALREGLRGLPAGNSLAKLLKAEFDIVIRRPPTVRQRPVLPEITTLDILGWADSFYARTSRWPTAKDGVIIENPELTWKIVDHSLKLGFRGLPGGSSLPRLLARERAVRNVTRPPALTIGAVLASADAHHARFGNWPNARSGPVADMPGETWAAIVGAFYSGSRGLPIGTSLAKLLEQERGAVNVKGRRPLTVDLILSWADAFYACEGKWPRVLSGPIPESPGDNWQAVHAALAFGNRTLPGGSSLARLLDEKRSARNYARLPRLTIETILEWADAYHARNDKWPGQYGGPIEESPGDTWRGVHQALFNGHRGLPKGESLSAILERERGVRNRLRLRNLREDEIVAWAQSFRKRHGRLPVRTSGPIEESPGDTWIVVANALSKGSRGLPGGTSLAKLLREQATSGEE